MNILLDHYLFLAGILGLIALAACWRFRAQAVGLALSLQLLFGAGGLVMAGFAGHWQDVSGQLVALALLALGLVSGVLALGILVAFSRNYGRITLGIDTELRG